MDQALSEHAVRSSTIRSPASAEEEPTPQRKIELLVEDVSGKVDKLLEQSAQREGEDVAEAVEACLARLALPEREHEQMSAKYLDVRRYRGEARTIGMLAFHCKLETRRILGVDEQP